MIEQNVVQCSHVCVVVVLNLFHNLLKCNDLTIKNVVWLSLH